MPIADQVLWIYFRIQSSQQFYLVDPMFFFLFTFLLRFNKILIYSLMNVCLHLCNHHPDQGNFNFYHLQDSLCFSQSILFSTKVATVMVLITIVLLVLELHISGIVYYVCYCFWLLLFKIMSEIHLCVDTIINLYFTEVENRIRRFK